MSTLRFSLVMAALTFATVLADADAAGNWRVDFVVPSGETFVNMTINQKGTTLTGNVITENGEYPLHGRVVDNRVTVEWTVPEDGEQLTITMNGTLEGDDITGTARLANIGEGSLSAHRMSRNP